MTALAHQEVEILAIGAGPSNLALAVAVEELAPPEVASETLVIERCESIMWQRGMLLPWTQSQVSFLKDLVTLRNPLSRFSFVNYLHSVGKLDQFINMASFLPFRLEISDYLEWVAKSLAMVRIEYSRDCVGIEPVAADGAATGWLARLADGSTIAARNLVFGGGRDAHIPAAFAGLPRERVIHSTEYARRIADVDPEILDRIVVVGAAQSAAEVLWDAHQRFPRAQCTMVIRSIGLDYYQTSKFGNELYFPSYTDKFFAAPEQTREQVLQAMRMTNYAGVTPDMLHALYRQMYQERLTGEQRLSMVTMVDVEAAEMADGEIVLTLNDRMRACRDELRCDLVLLGTGFESRAPSLVRGLADACGIGDVRVSRNYRMITPPEIEAGCYLQGINEATHGIADSLISVLAVRAGEIVTDLLEHREQAGSLGLRALTRECVMEIRKLDRDGMTSEYGVSVQRLVPWQALNAPFEGAWCVIEPGQATDPHAHHEYEIFIAISGEGALEAEGERSSFMPGDVVHFPPGTNHQVINAGDTDFQFYSVWWDPEMTEKFAARHTAGAARPPSP